MKVQFSYSLLAKYVFHMKSNVAVSLMLALSLSWLSISWISALFLSCVAFVVCPLLLSFAFFRTRQITLSQTFVDPSLCWHVASLISRPARTLSQSRSASYLLPKHCRRSSYTYFHDVQTIFLIPSTDVLSGLLTFCHSMAVGRLTLPVVSSRRCYNFTHERKSYKESSAVAAINFNLNTW